MALQKNIFLRYVPAAIAAACVVVAAVLCLFASSGLFPIDINDGSNFLLQVLYASHGFLPYKDYGFVYPPGSALFFGWLLHITNGGTLLRLVWLISFGLLNLNAYLITRLNAGAMRLTGAGLLTLVSVLPIVLLFRSHGTEPFTNLLLITALLLCLLYMRAKERVKSGLFFLALCGFMITMIRWDRALAMGFAALGVAAVFFVAARCGLFTGPSKVDAEHNARRITAAALALIGGAVAALALIAFYALGTDSWSETWWFLFGVLHQIMPYRNLPFPPLHVFDSGRLWLTSLTAIPLLFSMGIYYADLKTWSVPILVECLLLSAAPAAMLPYAFGRSDVVHFMPMASLDAAALVIACILWNNRKVRVVLCAMLIVLFLPLSSTFAPLYSLYTVAEGKGFSLLQDSVFDKNLTAATQDCARFIPADAGSLFVGRLSYEHFIDSPIILYLPRPDVPPAAPYIAEDPGIQNACDTGSQIADALRRAPRPMIAFLSMSPQWREPNATETMSSCGRIEKFLHETPAKRMGTCRVGPEAMLVVEFGP